MADVELEAHCAAAATEVWKLLHDPARFPEWWAGLERVEAGADSTTFYRSAWPDFAYPTLVSARQDGRRVIVSCQVSDIAHEWVLEPADGGGCRVRVRVSFPDVDAAILERVRAETAASLPRLVALAEGGESGSG